MIERKYAAPPFISMTADQLTLAADNIIIKLMVITGWQLIDNKLYQDELSRQLSLKLKEAYSTCNIEEIEYAFRNNSDIKDWGKNMNLNLIDEVMQPYLSARREASEVELQATKIEGLPATEITDEDVIQTARDIYAATKNHLYIPYTLYPRLPINLSDEEKDLIRTAAKAEVAKMVDEDKTVLGKMTIEQFETRTAKKMAIARYFEKEGK